MCFLRLSIFVLQGAHGLKGNEGPHGPPGPAVSTCDCIGSSSLLSSSSPHPLLVLAVDEDDNDSLYKRQTNSSGQ